MGLSEEAVIGIILIFGIVYLVIFILMIFGYITMMLAVSHSHKKRIVRGEDYSAGDVFLWYLGWGAATGYSFGIAPIIYYFVKRDEMRATKDMCTQVFAHIRTVNMQQAAQQMSAHYMSPQQQYPPQQYPPQQQNPYQ